MLIKAFFPLIFLLCFLSTAHAEIYRWVDGNGKIQFSDRPLDNKTEKVVVDIKHNSYKGGRVLERQQGLLDEYQAKDVQRAVDKKQADKQAVKDKNLQARCVRAKDQLENYKRSALYRLDEKGERIYYSEEQRTNAINRYQQAIQKNC